MDLPTELRCSLCNTIFKEAIMIPCCQNSFCDKYGESGIHAKETSCAISMRQKEWPRPHSPSTTGRGSNQVTAESAHGSERNSESGSHLIRLQSDKFGKSTVPPQKAREIKGDDNNSAEVLKRTTVLHESNLSSQLSENPLQEEANTTMQKKKGRGVIVSDGSGNLMQPSWHRKSGRNCYMCGSPDHLIRDCPGVSNTYQVNQTGDCAYAGGMPAYPQTYWHGASLAHAGSYVNMYGSPGLVPFDQAMVPILPFGISPYMSSMYPGTLVPYGFMRMEGIQHPMMTGAAGPYTRPAFMDPQDDERKHKSLDKHPEREHGRKNISEDYHYKGMRKVSQEQRHQLDEEATGSFLDNESQMIHKKQRHDKPYGFSHQQNVHSDELHNSKQKHEKNRYQSLSGRDQRSHHSEKSNSEVHDLSDSSNRHSRDKKKHRQEDCVKKQSKRRGHYSGSLSRTGEHQNHKGKSDDEKVVKDHRKHRHKHPHRSDSAVEHSSSGRRRHHYREKELDQCLRPFKQAPRLKHDHLNYDRWDMEDALDDEYEGAHHSHKRKRTRQNL